LKFWGTNAPVAHLRKSPRLLHVPLRPQPLYLLRGGKIGGSEM
jgi:hypothetical protein